jgi:hypothetical protein
MQLSKWAFSQALLALRTCTPSLLCQLCRGKKAKATGPNTPVLEFEPSSDGTACSHVVRVSLPSTVSSAVLTLPWPAETKGAKAIIHRKCCPHSTVEVTLPKSFLWPDDGPALGRISVEGLPAALEDDVENHMNAMFSFIESMSVYKSELEGRPIDPAITGPLF